MHSATLWALFGAVGAVYAAPSSVASGEADFTYTGRGVLVGDTATAYIEHYALRLRDGQPLRARTEYRERAGVLRAERTLDFGIGPAAWRPTYRLLDKQTGYEEGAEPRSGVPSSSTSSSPVTVRAYLRAGTGKPLREKTLQVPAPVVIDGGFVPFVRAHWDTLLTGARVGFHFVAVSRLDWFALELFHDAEASRAGRVAFVARPRHAALRLIVPETRVWFDPVTRRMVEFRGRSNLHDENGDQAMIRIVYTPARPVSSVATAP